MRVIAIKTGYYGGRVIYPNETFDVPNGLKGNWFEPLDPEPPGAEDGDIKLPDDDGTKDPEPPGAKTRKKDSKPA